MSAASVATRRGWPLERVVSGPAGSVTPASALLTTRVSPWFPLLSAFVGVNQWRLGVFGACPASLVLARVFAPRPAAVAS